MPIPNGARPSAGAGYIYRFQIMTDGIISAREANRFIADVEGLASHLRPGSCSVLNVALPAGTLAEGKPGIF